MKQFFFFFFLLLNFLIANYRESGKKIDGNEHLIKKKQDRVQKELIVKERLGEIVNKDILLTNSTGKAFYLKEIFQESSNTPWVVVFIYFRCPKLCGTVLDGIVENLSELKSKKLGKDYRLLTVSVDPTDTYQDAENYKQRLIKDYNNKFSTKRNKFVINEKDWVFAVGSKEQVTLFAKREIGFPYTYNERINEFEHPANFFILTSKGKISRYFYGIGVRNSFDLNLALAEAKLDKFRSTIDKILLYCYRFDAIKEGGYVLQAVLVMKLFGLAILIVVLTFLGYLTFSKKNKKEN